MASGLSTICSASTYCRKSSKVGNLGNYIMNRTARSLARLTPTLLTTTSLTTAPRLRSSLSSKHTTQTYKRAFTTTNPKMSNAQALIDLAKARRSYYPLSKDLAITPARVQEIVKDLLDHVPSSFNSQSNRAVVLFGAEHEKLWDITTEILKAIVPAEAWESTGGKMAMFKGAAGTVRSPPFPLEVSQQLTYLPFPPNRSSSTKTRK
jgi:hypothetical protein